MDVNQLVYWALLDIQGAKYLYDEHLEGAILHAAHQHGERPTDEEVAEAKRELQALLHALWNPQKEIC